MRNYINLHCIQKPLFFFCLGYSVLQVITELLVQFFYSTVYPMLCLLNALFSDITRANALEILVL